MVHFGKSVPIIVPIRPYQKPNKIHHFMKITIRQKSGMQYLYLTLDLCLKILKAIFRNKLFLITT